jgi:hypothetical protein
MFADIAWHAGADHRARLRHQRVGLGSVALEQAQGDGIGGGLLVPFSMKVLLENLLRFEDGDRHTARTSRPWSTGRRRAAPDPRDPVPAGARADAGFHRRAGGGRPRRDARRDEALGGDPEKINPLVPVHLVIDHSVMVDEFGTPKAFEKNVALEYERNIERYEFLKWGSEGVQQFRGGAAGHRHLPPGQSRIYRARRLGSKDIGGSGDEIAYPDTLVGTDSHTTMVNGLGVLGWGVGGIEAEAAMLGQPVSMLIPEVVGFHLTGKLKEGITATDLVLTVTQMLRKKGVVGKFVEFYGPGPRLPLGRRPGDDRQHGARIWRDLRLLPGRPQDASTICGSPAGPRSDRAHRGLCQGAGHVARAGGADDPVFTDARARHVERRAVAGRAEAAAGQGAALAWTRSSGRNFTKEYRQARAGELPDRFEVTGRGRELRRSAMATS